MLENSVSPMSCDTEGDVNCLQSSLTRRNEKLRMTFGAGRHTTLVANIPLTGNKNNQSSVFDPDGEIPTLGQRIMPGIR